MKVILAMVASIDGRTTKWSNTNIHEWTSEEDKQCFSHLIEKHNLILMGRQTYEAAKSVIKLSPGKLRIVMTKNPQKYSHLSVQNQLEFTNDTPEYLLKKLQEKGYKQALLVGGAHISTLFFKRNLIHEVWITIEPVIFGQGNKLVLDDKLDICLQLKSIQKLNAKGTILLKYTMQ